jgi:hypothetical protein
METTNFQRAGSRSNTHVGHAFEEDARTFFTSQHIVLVPGFVVPVGIHGTKKPHKFDLGCENPPILVECKSHTWTKTGNVPSAKITVWNEAMYYFHAAPAQYRKILFVLKDNHVKKTQTLANYYLRTHSHLVPDGVEIWEFDSASKHAEHIH